MLKNIFDLTSWGALTSEGCPHEPFGIPFNKVSGFPRKPKDAPDILNPSELYPDKELKLLLWGSPHGNRSRNDGSHHGPPTRIPSNVFKTQAFESMAWLCPRGTVIMTFPSKYKVEFYQPCSEAAAAKRILLCGPMYSREYVPMSSRHAKTWRICEWNIWERLQELENISAFQLPVPSSHFEDGFQCSSMPNWLKMGYLLAKCLDFKQCIASTCQV